MDVRGPRVALCALVVIALAGAAACTRTKKLTGEDDNVLGSLLYGVLDQDRDAGEYYRIVRESHEAQRFAYRVTEDKFLVDKTVDAVQRLGRLEYERLEGQAQVMALLADVLLEDPSTLAQANAANSLTRLALRLRPRRAPPVPERGDRFLALLREMDAMHAGGRRRTPPGSLARLARIVEQIGGFSFSSVALAKDALKPFYTRPYLVETASGAVRAAADTALHHRMREVARLALREAVDADTDYVREEAIRGLKTLRDGGALTLVLARLDVEPEARVRAEILEYLGTLGIQPALARAAIAALLPLLDDGDPTLRHKARQALTRIAGRDLGFRRATWTRWARARHPGIDRPRGEPGPGAGR